MTQVNPDATPDTPPEDAPAKAAPAGKADAKTHDHDQDHDHDHAHGHNHDHKAALKNPDGTWKYTNALEKESSPYLLQHAHNPVDWKPWGKEAFEEARKRGVPIFLSIGYSTCYWCHVMERQCFENEEIAKQMNKQFVCVKVDREERPDVDDIYMTATQMMTGGGGWPMSVFLTPPQSSGEQDPGLKPFFAGTYFPPVGQQGRPGFPQLMQMITDAWTTKKADVLESAEKAAEAITQHMSQRDEGGEVTVDLAMRAGSQMFRMYDPIHGGYGRAPKFPQPNNLMLLMAMHQRQPGDELWLSIAYTLERMARGGMYDQIGGGFHRYSTDGQWLVPHFEKMLYDNGQLVEAYLMAHKMRPDDIDPNLYTRVAREICDYVLKEMTDETGAFWSAQDAEVDAREGGNYVWLPEQIDAVIKDDKLATLAMEMYGLDKGRNFQDPHHPEAERVNVIFLPERLDALAKKHKLTTEQMAAKRREINALLYPARMKRKQPGTDDKVIVSWNGLMIAGLAMAGRDLDESRYTEAAAKAANYILKNMRTKDGGLYRTMRKGQVKINAFLEDYAFFAHGLLELYRTTKDDHWLKAAKDITAAAKARFADSRGGYFDTLADQPDLFVRTRTTYDGAISSGNSQMAHNLIDLYELTKDKAYFDQMVKDMNAFATALKERGVGMAHMSHALLRAAAVAPDAFKEEAAVAVVPAPAADATVPGQAAEVVTIAATPKQIDLSKGAATVRVTLKVAKGHHLNAPDPGDELLVPTHVRLEKARGYEIKVKYPEPVKRKYPFADKPIAVLEGDVVIEVTITKSATADANATPQLIVQYQACTDKECLKPRDVPVPLVFK